MRMTCEFPDVCALFTDSGCPTFCGAVGALPWHPAFVGESGRHAGTITPIDHGEKGRILKVSVTLAHTHLRTHTCVCPCACLFVFIWIFVYRVKVDRALGRSGSAVQSHCRSACFLPLGRTAHFIVHQSFRCESVLHNHHFHRSSQT